MKKIDTDFLVLQIQAGRDDLIEPLWLAVKDLIAWYARRYFTLISSQGAAAGGVEVEDLIQCGFLALVEAVQGHDPSKGSFTTILYFYLKKAFREAIGRSERQLRDPLNNCLSLDVPLNDDDPDGETRLEALPDQRNLYDAVEDRILNEELHEALEKALDKLPENRARVIRAEYFEGKSQSETAEELGVSKQRVHQLKSEALHRMRKGSSSKELERFLDEGTTFYKHTGLTAFIQKQESAVERMVIKRELMRRKYGRMFSDDGESNSTRR